MRLKSARRGSASDELPAARESLYEKIVTLKFIADIPAIFFPKMHDFFPVVRFKIPLDILLIAFDGQMSPGYGMEVIILGVLKRSRHQEQLDIYL